MARNSSKKCLLLLSILSVLVFSGCIRVRNFYLFNATDQPVRVKLYERKLYKEGAWVEARRQEKEVILKPNTKSDSDYTVTSSPIYYQLKAETTSGDTVFKFHFDYYNLPFHGANLRPPSWFPLIEPYRIVIYDQRDPEEISKPSARAIRPEKRR